MASNFDFLKLTPWQELFEQASQAEQYVHTDPRSSAFYSRLALETALHWLFDGAMGFPDLYDLANDKGHLPDISSLLNHASFRKEVPEEHHQELHYVRLRGNDAAHKSKNKVTPYHAESSLQRLHHFLQWLAATYELEENVLVPFNAALIPTTSEASRSLEQLQQLQDELNDKAEKLLAFEKKARELEEQEEKQKVEKQKGGAAIPVPAPTYTEAETRQLFIDVLLREAGWDPDAPRVSEYPLTGLPAEVSKTGKGIADYVLWGDDGKPLAVVEAKRTLKSKEQGRQQAYIYADALEQMHGQRPVIFYSNGFEHAIWDDIFYPPRSIQGFYTKDELQLLVNRRSSRLDIRKQPVDKKIAGRPYQLNVIQRVSERFADEHCGRLVGAHRRALVVMATGTGKTRTAAALVDVLSKANWAKRVLFLADRNALVRQAKKAFNQYLPDLTAVNLVEEKEDPNTRLVFSTYPTIMNLIDGERKKDGRYYGVGHFDLVILDEAHRSVYKKYGAIFEYFDALLLGLTATPRGETDRDTYNLFNCSPGDPTAYYELDEAIDKEYLRPPVGKPVDLGFLRKGIKYNDLSPAEKLEYEEKFGDSDGHYPDEIDATAINQWLYNKDTVRKTLAHLMEHGLKVEGGDKLGKTIIFARQGTHAELIYEIFNQEYPQYGGKFAQVIDIRQKSPEQLIEDFSLPAKHPQIAISVDMLDTGIDVPEVLNLVFFKPVYSRTKYWQMIGRGTRLCENLFGPGMNKKHFYVFDFCGNFKFFEHNPDGIVTPDQESLSSQLFMARIQLAEAFRAPEYQDNEHQQLRQDYLIWARSLVEQLWNNRQSFRIAAKLQHVEKFHRPDVWQNLSGTDMASLREHLAPLVEVPDKDEQAKRFDLLILRLQLARVSNSSDTDRLHRQLVTTAHNLGKISNVPAVKEKIPVISSILGEQLLSAFTDQRLEKIRRDLRDLVRLIEKDKQAIIYTDFVDRVDEVGEDVSLIKNLKGLETYRTRVEKFIRQNQSHLVIRKLHTNQPITSDELQELERILFSAGDLGTREEFQQELGHDKPLGVFIRSILGLEASAAQAAFSDLLQKATLSADQQTFIQHIIKHFELNGIVDPALLYESPFTDINYEGLDGVFPEEAKVIIQTIRQINNNAVA